MDLDLVEPELEQQPNQQLEPELEQQPNQQFDPSPKYTIETLPSYAELENIIIIPNNVLVEQEQEHQSRNCYTYMAFLLIVLMIIFAIIISFNERF